MKKLSSVLKAFVLMLPFVLFFSYYPVISLGKDGAMNYELSLPLIWLVLFDVVGVVMLVWRDGVILSFKKILGEWKWLLFPVFLSLSCLWSGNMGRGVLTSGILWAIYLAGYIMYNFREVFDEEFKAKFWKSFFGASLIVCGLLILQCILDLAGVSREYTLMCAGCTYRSFGFPHPNGFAIEPQFMGNMLLAPMMVMAYMMIKKWKPLRALLMVVFVFALFLTFSRGAIYAGAVGLIFLSVMMAVGEKKKRKDVWKRVGIVWGMVVIGFLATLNLQGIMAEVSPTNDTYYTGVSKVINHLSLGVIDIGGNGDDEETEVEVVENPVENSEEKEEAVFDGYVAESTDVRVGLTRMAITGWRRDFWTVMLGVGLGGAGVALYDMGLTVWPKEIVQNQYASLLLETGIVGISLLIISLVLLIREALRQKQAGLILALMVAYGISLFFFSGLPNVLHIYLLMPLLMCIKGKNELCGTI